MNVFQQILNWLQTTWRNSVNSLRGVHPALFYAPPPVPILGPDEFLTPEEASPNPPYSTLNRPAVSRPSYLSRLVGKHPLLPYPYDTSVYPEHAVESTGGRIIKPTWPAYTYESLAHLHARGYSFPFNIDKGARAYFKRLQHRSFIRHGFIHAPGHGPTHSTSQSEPRPKAKHGHRGGHGR